MSASCERPPASGAPVPGIRAAATIAVPTRGTIAAAARVQRQPHVEASSGSATAAASPPSGIAAWRIPIGRPRDSRGKAARTTREPAGVAAPLKTPAKTSATSSGR
jgi:hypothetical protein